MSVPKPGQDDFRTGLSLNSSLRGHTICPPANWVGASLSFFEEASQHMARRISPFSERSSVEWIDHLQQATAPDERYRALLAVKSLGSFDESVTWSRTRCTMPIPPFEPWPPSS